MASSQPLIPKQPKLRSSCDACGAAKLRCDRTQPECQRCISRGVTCVYGVSRKMGKPPRDRSRLSCTPQTSNDRADPMDADAFDMSSNSSRCGNILDLGPFLNLPDMSTFGGDSLDEHGGDCPPNFPSLDFGDWAATDRGIDNLLHSNLHVGQTISTPELSLDLGSYSSSGDSPAQSSSAPLSRAEERSIYHGRASAMASTGGCKDHDCSQKAYEILGSLSCVNLEKSLSIGSGSATAGVPLDHVLRLNREASERLGSLLSCSCARSPNMALLYASSIARVLVWYQQATVCTQSTPSWNAAPVPIPETTESRRDSPGLSLPGYGSRPGEGPSSIWPRPATTNTFSSGSGTKSTPSSSHSSTELPVAPANVAIGTFNVDDSRVQAALKVQLLFGEMRIAAHLIDQFIASHNFGSRPLGDESHFGGVESLYQSLDSWLRSEHSRISSMMRSKLRELNA